jgi:hypothetical protein
MIDQAVYPMSFPFDRAVCIRSSMDGKTILVDAKGRIIALMGLGEAHGLVKPMTLQERSRMTAYPKNGSGQKLTHYGLDPDLDGAGYGLGDCSYGVSYPDGSGVGDQRL